MKISAIQQYYCQQPNKAKIQGFTSIPDIELSRTDSGKPMQLMTRMFRKHTDWNALGNFIEEKYAYAGKVNVYCFACSDGSEAYTMAMLLMSKLGNRASKFFKIIASDINPGLIQTAKSGLIRITDGDIRRIKDITGKDATEFFEYNNQDCEFINRKKFISAKVKPELRNVVEFHEGNVLDEIKSIKPDNSIVMFRYAWPYLTQTQREQLFKSLTQMLGRNSTYICGPFDLNPLNGIRERELLDYGLKRTEVEYCYTK